MELNQIYEEPCLDTLAKMSDESIDCVITSPPYWQLRDYGYEGQWGLEPTFQEYLEHLWSMMDEIYRVLKPQGTVWINLGDTYNTTSGRMGSSLLQPKFSDGSNVSMEFKQQKSTDIATKCLLLIPHRFAIGCIDRGWIVRNDIIWAKRNGMPESVTDRFSKKHEYFFLMVKSEKYYFDLDAIRDKSITNENRPDGIVRNRLYGYDSKMNNPELNPKATTKIPKLNAEKYGSPRARQHRQGYSNAALGCPQQDTNGGFPNPLGKNPGSVSDFWEGANKPTFDEYMKQCADYYNSQDDFFDIPTKPSSEKHYASYNDSLLTKPVLAGCPVGGIIYDPFMGTGSTAEVALRTSRKFIGSEMSAEYCKIAEKRLRKFTVESLF